jgi:hypothetical protein
VKALIGPNIEERLNSTQQQVMLSLQGEWK